MTVFERDYSSDTMNYIQFMQMCITECLSYEEYRQSAINCDKHVVSPRDYESESRRMEEEAYWASL